MRNGFYIGIRKNKKKNLVAKIGETGRALNERIKEIRKNEYDFTPVYFIQTPTATKAQRLLIEAWTREKLERIGYINSKNDHFRFEVTSKPIADYDTFCTLALMFALQACVHLKIEYELIKM